MALSDLISSEYGVALLLDNHVNRPAYVVPSVAKALKSLSLTPQASMDGGTGAERRLIDVYLEIRRTFGRTPMTSAGVRGETTRTYLRTGRLSDERGSFQTNASLRARAR